MTVPYLNKKIEILFKFWSKIMSWFDGYHETNEDNMKIAVHNNDLEKLLHILINYCPSRQINNCESLLNICMINDKINILENLIDQHYLHPSNYINRYLWSPLHKAVYFHNFQLVQLLIKKGANIYAREVNGNTALHIAMQRAQDPSSYQSPDGIKIVQLLLDTCNNNSSDALVNSRNNFEKTPLHYCVSLLPNRFTINLLKILINSGCDIDPLDSYKRTPFYYLIKLYHNQMQCGQQLLLFINIMLSANCDPLNWYKIGSLKHLSRMVIKKHYNIHKLKNLPPSLNKYLERNIPIVNQLKWDHYKKIL